METDPAGELEPERLGDSAGMRLVLPVGRSPWAIASGYLGLMSIWACAVPMCVFFAPLALLTGVIGIWDIHKHRHKHGLVRAYFGIAMGLIGSTLYILTVVAGGRPT